MAEVITETILPGTYIEVRAEGLLTIGAISTGNIGIVGTAEMGSTRVETLDSYEQGRARFGEPGEWDANQEANNLSLVRSLKLLFENGARTVYARRVVAVSPNNAAKAATFELTSNSNEPLATLRAKTPGTGGNRLQIRIEEGEAQENVSNELLVPDNGKFALSAIPQGNGQTTEAVLGNVTVRDNGLTTRYQLKTSASSSQVVQINTNTGALTFASRPSAKAEIRATYFAPKNSIRKITLRLGNLQEVYYVPSVSYLVQRLQEENNPSRLVEVVKQVGNDLPKITTRVETFKGGENGTVAREDFQAALDDLVDRDVQLVVVAGRTFSDSKADVLGHVEKTENLGRERIAIIGADSSYIEKILENANEVADKRVVLVGPGLKQSDPDTGKTVELPPCYAAAAVAGKLSSLSPHISLTNKTLAGIDALTNDFNYGDLKALVQNRVLTLQEKRGIRVVKGISTDDEAFKQITLRRIVDYVKEGTRLGANQYIGKLNNKRVRENLRTTLDGFLADLLRREFLTGYKLTVFADRTMEIRGEVKVTMELNPTFSIDVIKVVMNLS